MIFDLGKKSQSRKRKIRNIDSESDSEEYCIKSIENKDDKFKLSLIKRRLGSPSLNDSAEIEKKQVPQFMLSDALRENTDDIESMKINDDNDDVKGVLSDEPEETDDIHSMEIKKDDPKRVLSDETKGTEDIQPMNDDTKKVEDIQPMEIKANNVKGILSDETEDIDNVDPVETKEKCVEGNLLFGSYLNFVSTSISLVEYCSS